jgi:exocyst complex component 7
MVRLNPAYLKSAIDDTEWESLESAMALWSPHFHVAVAAVLAAERWLCARVLDPLPSAIWPECFAKIAARIVAAFFRFADGVAAAAREPQRLFKLPDMLDAGIRERDRLDALFASEPSSSSATLRAIRERAREMERTLARAAAGVFFEFGFRVETHHVTGADAAGEHVPKIVRYAVNYLKCLASDDCRALVEAALRAEREPRDECEDGVISEVVHATPLAEAASNILEALRRRRGVARHGHERVLVHLHARARLGAGEAHRRGRHAAAEEEAAWEYQDAAWTPLVGLVSGSAEGGGVRRRARGAGAEARGRVQDPRQRSAGADQGGGGQGGARRVRRVLEGKRQGPRRRTEGGFAGGRRRGDGRTGVRRNGGWRCRQRRPCQDR